jgi:tRNA1(Val) A37 N6-methylase TrmN6
MDLTEDRILGGRIVLRQGADGYRAGMDAALLAAACDARRGETVLEAGCGVGAVLLAAATRRIDAVFVGIEADARALALAEANIGLNGLATRVGARAGDVGAPFRELKLKTFDAVLANPPFFDDARRLRPPVAGKVRAWMNEEGLAHWAAFLTAAVRAGGTITIIHRADRLGDLLSALSPKAGSFQIRPIQPFADAPAKRVLLRAVKTGKAPLRILPALSLHDRSGAKHTPEAEAILRGEASIPWD